MVMEQMEPAENAKANTVDLESDLVAQNLSAEGVDKVIKTGEKVVQAGKEAATLGKDVKDLYDSLKEGNWQKVGEASIKTIQDLLSSTALKELGKGAVDKLKQYLKSKQEQQLMLPDLEIA